MMTSGEIDSARQASRPGTLAYLQIPLGMFDHGTIGLLTMLFAAAVGIGGAGLSLLLLWPGLEYRGSGLHAAAAAHASLLLFFSAVPASLGGLAVMSVPGLVGSGRSAFPWMPLISLALTLAALCAVVAGLFQPHLVMAGAAATSLAIATFLVAADLVATILIERKRPYPELATSVWTTLTAAALAACAAPMMAAVMVVSLWRGVSLEASSSTLAWPALWIVLILMIGLVSDIFSAQSSDSRLLSLLIVALSAGGVAAAFMVWGTELLHRSAAAPNGLMLRTMIDVLILPITLIWALMLVRGSAGAFRQLPVLFAIGFALILLLGLLLDATGRSSHEAISIAVVFGLFAGFFGITESWTASWLARNLAHIQFWFLLAGSVILLIRRAEIMQAIGASLLGLSVILFAICIVATGVRRLGEISKNRNVGGIVGCNDGCQF